MKTVKIKIVGWWSDEDFKACQLYRAMSKHYNVVFSGEPDYIICSVFGKAYDYCKYPQVRIMYVGENYIPDFNLVDYGICNYPILLQDRAFYFPFFIDEFGHCESLTVKDRSYPSEILQEKCYFANFIAGHESEHGIRGDFFKKLCEYKRVESPGKYLNNMPNGEIVHWNDDSKRDFQRKCKFTLCFESTRHEGFITEKITDAFYADTIPVYYGSDSVKEIFNSEAFINCSDFDSFTDAIDYIKELDQDDEKYLQMLRQPIFLTSNFPQKKLDELERFVVHIFDQPLDKAKRRSEVYTAKNIEKYLLKARIGPINKVIQKAYYCRDIIGRKLKK